MTAATVDKTAMDERCQDRGEDTQLKIAQPWWAQTAWICILGRVLLNVWQTLHYQHNGHIEAECYSYQVQWQLLCHLQWQQYITRADMTVHNMGPTRLYMTRAQHSSTWDGPDMDEHGPIRQYMTWAQHDSTLDMTAYGMGSTQQHMALAYTTVHDMGLTQ